MANENEFYCPIFDNQCIEDGLFGFDCACMFWNEREKRCLIESTLTKVSAVADAIKMRIRDVSNGGDTPEPHETKQKEV